MYLKEFNADRAATAQGWSDTLVCLTANMRTKFTPFDDPARRSWRMPLEVEAFGKMHKGDILRNLIISNRFSVGHGRKFYWPVDDLLSLERVASAAGYTLSVKTPANITFDFVDGVMTPGQASPTAKTVLCVPTYFNKEYAAGVGRAADSSYLKDLDLMREGDDVSAYLGGDLPGYGARAIRGNQALLGMGLILAGRQYNLWCKVIYGVEPLVVELHPATGRPTVTRVSGERPLPEWTIKSWGARRARTGVFMKDCAVASGVALVSVPQLNTLRAGLYTSEGAGNYMCSIEGRSILHIHDNKPKIKREPAGDATHRVHVTMIKVVKKTAD